MSFSYLLSCRTRINPSYKLPFLRLVQSSASQQKSGFNILFLGRDEFSCLVLQQLYTAKDVWEGIWIATQPDVMDSRRKMLSISPLKILAESLGLPVHTIPHHKPDFRTWQPPALFNPPSPQNVLVTASFGRILSSPLLRLFDPHKRLNVHPSLLPAYRGAAPIQHTLLNGEKETGVCVIEMLERAGGIDAGAVWGCSRVPVSDDASFVTLRDTLAREGGRLLSAVLRDLLYERATSTPQASAAFAPRAPMITIGDSFVDFVNMSAEVIVRRHRALSHQRPLTTYMPNGQCIQLHSLAVYNASPSYSIPKCSAPGAAAYHAPTRSLLIRCADGSVLSVARVKQEGKALLDAKEWWNGMKGLGLVRNSEAMLGRNVVGNK